MLDEIDDLFSEEEIFSPFPGPPTPLEIVAGKSFISMYSKVGRDAESEPSGVLLCLGPLGTLFFATAPRSSAIRRVRSAGATEIVGDPFGGEVGVRRQTKLLFVRGRDKTRKQTDSRIRA